MIDIVKQAEEFVLNKLSEPDRRDPSKRVIHVTTSQIRKFLTAVNQLQNKMNNEKDVLSVDTANEIKYLKVKLAYQAGREKKTKVLHDNLVPMIDKIGNDKKEFIKFAKYVEAIVAYHKFHGGKD